MNSDNTTVNTNVVILNETETDKLYQSLVPGYQLCQEHPRIFSVLIELYSSKEQLLGMLVGDKMAFYPREYLPQGLMEARKKLGINNLGERKFMIMNSKGEIGVFSGHVPNLYFSRSYHDLFNRDISDVEVIVLPENNLGEKFKRKVCELLIPLEERVQI